MHVAAMQPSACPIRTPLSASTVINSLSRTHPGAAIIVEYSPSSSSAARSHPTAATGARAGHKRREILEPRHRSRRAPRRHRAARYRARHRPMADLEAIEAADAAHDVPDPVVASSPPVPPPRDRSATVRKCSWNIPKFRAHATRSPSRPRSSAQSANATNPTRTERSSSPTVRGLTRSSNRNRSTSPPAEAAHRRPTSTAPQTADPRAAAETVPAPAPRHHTPADAATNPRSDQQSRAAVIHQPPLAAAPHPRGAQRPSPLRLTATPLGSATTVAHRTPGENTAIARRTTGGT